MRKHDQPRIGSKVRVKGMGVGTLQSFFKSFGYDRCHVLIDGRRRQPKRNDVVLFYKRYRGENPDEC